MNYVYLRFRFIFIFLQNSKTIHELKDHKKAFKVEPNKFLKNW